jgi:hypothetical protein
MADFELNLSSPQACTGDNGVYVGVLYHLSEHGKGLITPFDMDDPRYDVRRPGTLIKRTRTAIKKERGIEVVPDKLIALAVNRLCTPKVSEDEEELTHERVRLERVASLAIANAATDIEKINPLTKQEIDSISSHGVGYAHRIFPGQAPIKPIVHLPVTSTERQGYPVLSAIRSLATGKTLSSQPYIALHGSEHGYIEQIVTPDQL